VRRIALFAFSIFVLGAVLPLACTQNFNQYESSGGTGASGSSSSSSTSTSSGGMCTDAADCTPSATKCITVSCMDKKCASTDAAQGTACTDSGGSVCDGNGTCVACEMASDCPAQATLCITNTCNNNACGTTNAPQGTTCGDNNGKVCNNAGTCVGCNSTSDCTGTDICKMSTCVAATCNDGIKDGNETDVDCGGSCPGCPNSEDCNVGGDCQSGYCNSGKCAACSSDGNCASGNYCNSGSCSAAQATGQACTGGDGTQCSSGNCVDGFCCDMPCNGTCQACSNMLKGAGPDGHCGDIKAGSDPKMQCTDMGAASCGNDGSCDGNGACQNYGMATQCVAAGCNAGELTTARFCSGTGTCQAGMMTSCSPYAGCNGAMCASTCGHSDANCVMGFYCDGTNHCSPAQANGQACTGGDGNQCTSTFCVDSVCCATACSGPCNVCGGANGTCGNAASGTACMSGGNPGVCTGMGGGATSCVQCVANMQCMTAGKAVCDMTSNTCVQCATGSTSACTAPNPVCDTMADMEHDTCVACNVSGDCTSANDACTAAHTCLLASGQPCTMNSQCASGTCTGGTTCM
jgi:hypothetical protein